MWLLHAVFGNVIDLKYENKNLYAGPTNVVCEILKPATMDKTQVQKIENMFNHACARAHANVGHAIKTAL